MIVGFGDQMKVVLLQLNRPMNFLLLCFCLVRRFLLFRVIFFRICGRVMPHLKCVSWKLLCDRIRTKANHVKRRLLQESYSNILLCGLASENFVHLFLHCRFASSVWFVMAR